MFKIIYVSFEPGGGYDKNEIVPEMCEEQFETIEEAQEYIKEYMLEAVRDEVICAIGEKAKKEGVKYDLSFEGDRATIDVLEPTISPYQPIVERHEYRIVEI
jgi:hypothetical protein